MTQYICFGFYVGVNDYIHYTYTLPNGKPLSVIYS